MSNYEPNRSRLPADVCEHLCTKTMYIGQDDRRSLEESAGMGPSTATFWCVFTQFPLGPDGDEVSPEACRPGRACCTPTFTLRTPSV
jgi:hypothetical protein